MKKIFLLLYGTLALCSSSFANTQVIECAHSASSVLLAMGSLSESGVCQLKQVLNGTESNSDKWTLICNNSELDNYQNAVENNITVFTTNDFINLMADETNGNLFVETIIEDLGIVNGGATSDCAAYNAAIRNIGTQWKRCLRDAAIACGLGSGSVLIFSGCYGISSSLCHYDALVDINATRSQYPDCGNGTLATDAWWSESYVFPNNCNSGQ
jgi:hypothetical protein